MHRKVVFNLDSVLEKLHLFVCVCVCVLSIRALEYIALGCSVFSPPG